MSWVFCRGSAVGSQNIDFQLSAPVALYIVSCALSLLNLDGPSQSDEFWQDSMPLYCSLAKCSAFGKLEILCCMLEFGSVAGYEHDTLRKHGSARGFDDSFAGSHGEFVFGDCARASGCDLQWLSGSTVSLSGLPARSHCRLLSSERS